MKLLKVNILFVLILALSTNCNTSIDIRNDYLKNGISEDDILKGKDILNKMEEAYGGKQNWLKYEQGKFIQKADWYGRTKLSNWDTIPQLFKMSSKLGSDDSELTLLNGKNKGTKYWINDGIFKTQEMNKDIVEVSKTKYHEKMIFKNYWFQFPFRIGEAQIISYGGEETINGKNYNVIYATWGEASANNDYDQFLLYLDQTSNKIEFLYFTVRDKMRRISLTAEFTNFKKVNEFELPFSQYVRYGSPFEKGIKFHENHYQEISFE